MMFNFDMLIDRRHTNSLKWNVRDGMLPMWVADMDFQTAPCVQKAIQQKAELGIFGYHDIPEAYFESYQGWWKKRHDFEIKREWMVFSSGVVAAISSIVRKLTTPAEKVLLQSPVYNIFYNSILNNGREVISNDLVYEHGSYTIDFEDLERKLADPQTTLMILCNPHNPIGRIWSKEELARIGALCHKHHVLVISDEVHCDLVVPAMQYTPFASVNAQCADISITCLSGSKAFNLAGLQAACMVIPNEYVRHRVWRGLNTDEVAEPNSFACEATIAAFQEGEEWLQELAQYLYENRRIASKFLKERLPKLHLVDATATYLLWIDCFALSIDVERLCMYLEEQKNLKITSGASYGKNGASFIRINAACPKKRLLEGLKRLQEGIEEFIAQDE